MDKAGLNLFIIHSFILFTAVVISACVSAPPEQKAVAVASSMPAITPAPIEIRQPVNVSFSTYSKDWPVDWQWVDPDEAIEPSPHNVKGGVLRIAIPAKKALTDTNRSAPRYLKAIKGDFEIETRVMFAPKENYQGAGLLIFWNDDHYLKFERVYGGTGGGGEGVRLEARRGSEHVPIATPVDIQTQAPDVLLRIVRTGTTFVAFWKEDDDHEWREAGEFESDYPDVILAGVMAENTARPAVAEFAYIRLLPSTRR
jgi:regulation of enolase protein 1 (concanavalin A-like superfamily)